MTFRPHPLLLAIPALVLTLHCFAQPVITSFTPAKGPIGTVVTINGSGFGASTATNLVSFGGIKARVLTATANTLTVAVPGGTIYKPLTVTTGGLTAASVGAFDVSFPGGGSPLTPTAFVPAGSLYTGMSSLVSGLADFNGDGKMDLFSVQGLTQGLVVYINNSIGHTITFGQTLALNTASTSHLAAAAADLDGDGMSDIIISNNSQTYSLSVYRNTSTATSVSFAANQDFPANNQPGEIAVGDLDGDGKPDLVVVDGAGGVISFFRNTSTPGSISFAQRVDLNPGSIPASISIADLDQDGKPDLVLATNTGLGSMKNLSTPGNLSFGAFYVCATGTQLVSARAGDLDGDGKPDLVAADISGNTIVVVKNNSTPGSIAFAAAQNITCALNTNHVDIEDMDGDGKPDLVSSNINYTNVSIFRNTGTGSTLTFDAAADYSIGNVSLSFSAVADMDANGRPDIIAGTTGFLIDANMVGAAPPTISSYTPTAGVTGTPVTIIGTNFTSTTAVNFGDSAAGSFIVNSDTSITAIVGGGSSGNLTVENADATATAAAGFFFYPPVIRDFYPAIGDKGSAITIYGSNFANITEVKFGNSDAASFTVDSLGGITAIVGDGGTGDISVISPNGTATLPGFTYSPPVISSFSPLAGEVGSIVTITGRNFSPDTTYDIVRFGAVKASLVSASATQLQVSVPAGASYQPLSVTTDTRTAFATKPFLVTFPSDDPTITAHSFANAGNFPTVPNPTQVVVSDLDGDGKPDMVVLGQGGYFSLFLSSSSIGKIGFAPRTDYYSNADDPVRILLQDMNGDGRPEIIVLNGGAPIGNYSPNQVSVISNNLYPGGGFIGGHATVYTTAGTQGICVADMNGDGLPDIVVSNGSTGTISVYPNTTYYGGDIISFGQAIDYPAIGHPDYIIAADLDQDGRPDLIAADASGNTLTTYRNTSTGGKFGLASGINQATVAGPTYIAAGDLRGTGLPDLVSGQNATSAAIADLNGDGKADLGFGRTGTGLVSLWQNNYPGTGPLTFTPTVDLNAGQGDTWYFSGDLDGDSKPDLIIANPGQNSVSIFRNTIGDPVITAVTPDTAYKGTLIRITGRNFTGGTNTSFGGVSADSMHVVSSTEIDAVVGPGASGNTTITTLFGLGSVDGFVFIPQIIAEGDTVFCSGKSVTLRSTAASNNQWYNDGVPIAGDTVLIADSSGSYTVQTTSNGITTVSPPQIVNVITIPPPVITENDSANLVSSTGTGNQWYYDSYLALDTTRIIKPGAAGTYTVTETRDGCTSVPSMPYYWGGAQAIQLPDDQYIRVYPNPVTNFLLIGEHVNSQPLLLDLTFTDDRGQILLVVRQTAGAIVDVSPLPVGIIFVHVHADGPPKVDKTVTILKIK